MTGDPVPRPPHSESVPSSPRSTVSPGEVSPLKEYIRKSWANKFDKKSLSLDLDSRGRKIITAIEDKRKSIVSHFIPEEGLVMPSTSVITEHKGEVSTYSSNTETESNRVFTFDSSTQQVSSNFTQQLSADTSSTTSTVEDYEEIGVDYIANMDDPTIFDPHDGKSWFEHLESIDYFAWTKSPDGLQERPLGRRSDAVEEATSISSDADDANNPPTGPAISSVFINMFHSLTLHPWTKLLIAVLGAGLFIPMNSFVLSLFWFIIGILFSAIIFQSLTESPEASERTRQRFYGVFTTTPETSVNKIIAIDPGPSSLTKRIVFYKSTQE